MTDLNIVYKKIEDLKEFGDNSKIHTKDQVEAIAAIINEFGWTQNLVIDKNNVLVQGHGRLQAARLLGLTEVPCRVMEEEYTDAELDALRIIDNRLAETGWNRSLLDQDLNTYDYDFSKYKLDFSLKEQEQEYIPPSDSVGITTEEELKKITLTYQLDQYEAFMAKASQAIELNNLKDISNLIKKLLLNYASKNNITF